MYCAYCECVLCFHISPLFTRCSHVVLFLLLQILMNVTAILATTLVPTMNGHLCVGVMKDIDWKEAQLV